MPTPCGRKVYDTLRLYKTANHNPIWTEIAGVQEANAHGAQGPSRRFCRRAQVSRLCPKRRYRWQKRVRRPSFGIGSGPEHTESGFSRSFAPRADRVLLQSVTGQRSAGADGRRPEHRQAEPPHHAREHADLADAGEYFFSRYFWTDEPPGQTSTKRARRMSRRRSIFSDVVPASCQLAVGTSCTGGG